MQIKSFRIKNYKSYNDTETIDLAPGMNVITGQNNAGKSALLQALSLTFRAEPHRSIAVMPSKVSRIAEDSTVRFTIELSGTELSEIADEISSVSFSIPQSGRPDPALQAQGIVPPFHNPETLAKIWDWLTGQLNIEFKLGLDVSVGGHSFYAQSIPSHGLYQLQQNSGTNFSALRRTLGRNKSMNLSHLFEGRTSDLGVALAPAIAKRVYRFSAERFTPGEAPFGSISVLNPDASNLAQALATLQPNAAKFADYMQLVSEVLPQVRWISIAPEGEVYRIRVWSVDKQTQREDLAIPLSESGTGIGQVLAILYVAFTSDVSRVILIDEPQSFLHPGAARKLMGVLKNLPQHQYIITTHSPSIVSAADAEQVIIAKMEEGVSTLGVSNARESGALQAVLEDVGARLSDVFGMDQVFWVEGATEELVFPKILAKLKKYTLAGTAVVGIRNTGDLEGRDAKKIFEIYRNLTGKASLLPPALAFVMDSENRTEEEQKELQKLSENKLHFLPVRMIENYLLNPSAITAVVNGIEGFSLDSQVDQNAVEVFLTEALGNRVFYRPQEIPSSAQDKHDHVNAAKVLESLFKAFSETRVEYQKTLHSVALFDWLLENDETSLQPLADFLKELIDGSMAHQ